jgi:hypothetical protein
MDGIQSPRNTSLAGPGGASLAWPRCSNSMFLLAAITLAGAASVVDARSQARVETFSGTAPSDPPATSRPPATSNSAFSKAAPYCADLKSLAALTTTKDKFASITGEPREGNFLHTSLPLTGWKDCSLYGSRTYTCDSQELGTAEEAEKAQATAVHQIRACLGEAWTEDNDRSSSSYVVVRNAAGSAAITISMDTKDKNEYVVRLVLFLRGD